MINLLAGAAIVGLLLYGLKFFAKADPRKLARLARTVGGWAALLVAAFLALRGQIVTAVPLGLFGLSLIGWNVAGSAPWNRTRKSPGRISKVRTAFLEMELDHDSGRLTGDIVNGPMRGTSLEGLDLATIAKFAAQVDDESRQLLETYLDRRSPGWREHAEGDMGGGRAQAPRRGTMTEEEAYQILGLQPGAGADDIGKAHRSLMKKLHPDQGGSNYLAARVNEAKDVLMRGHR